MTTHIPGANGHGRDVRPPAPPRPRRRSPVIVHVLGRWFQALAGIVLMIGLGAAQFVMLKARGHALAGFLTLGGFLAFALVFFFIGRGLIHGRRWAWRSGAVLSGTVLLFLVYAVANAPQPPAQRTAALGVTAVLFGVPVLLLGFPSVRAFFASVAPDRVAVILVAALALVTGCTTVQPHLRIPELRLGEPAFYPTLEAYAGAPIVPGNRIEVLLNGDEIFPTVLDTVRSARRTVTYLQYSWEPSRMANDLVDAFADRCRNGVAVHVLVDGLGGLKFAPEHRERLEAAGCRVATFRPLGPFTLRRANNRNHRRILVVDGRVGWTGGSGVGPKWEGDGRTEGHWRDTDVKIAGPVVQHLQAAFAANWLEATGVVLGDEAYFPGNIAAAGDIPAQVVASTPSRGASEIYTTFLLAITSARRSIAITNPYFLPDERLLAALIAARRRGVHVRVLLPGQIDHAIVRQASRAGFRPLFEAGVEIWEYQPALLHAKTMVIDGVFSTVGTTNFDNRSFALHQELNLIAYSPTVGARLEAVFADDLTRARRITYEAWRRRPIGNRLIELLILPLRDLL